MNNTQVTPNPGPAGAGRWLPPFPALRAFHAAARHGRFRDAAAELGVSESAISHQVRRLEDVLHLKLFDRNGPRVRLTAQGARYFEAVDPALAQIAEATRALVGPAERTRVALTLPPSLAILWLIPALADFERACPGIDLQLVTTTRLVDLRREQIDLAIRYGRGPWPEVAAEALLAETATPVCRPGLLDPESATDMSAVLASQRLVVSGHHPDEWAEWARAHGLEPPDMAGALRLDAQDQALAAAEQGLGLAMGRRPLVDDRLAAGVLIAPFGGCEVSEAGYHLCRPPGATPSAAARRVAAWLRAVAGKQTGPS